VFYVSPSGSDANDGHAQTTGQRHGPWLTLGKVSAGHYNPGDRILFQGGQTFSGSLSFNASSWTGATASNPVTIGSFGSGAATINSSAVSTEGFHAVDVEGFILENLKFVGNGGSSWTNGVSVLNTGNTELKDIILRHLDVTGYGGNGVDIAGDEDRSGYENLTLSYVTSHSNTTHIGSVSTSGIYIGSRTRPEPPGHWVNKHVLIDHCIADSNPGNSSPPYPNWSGSGIMLSSTQGGTIQYSVAANNGAASGPSYGPVGIFVAHSDKINVQYNEAYGNWSSSQYDGDGFDFEGVSNSVVQYNYSHDNYSTGFFVNSYVDSHGDKAITHDLVLRYNVSQNDHRSPTNPWNYGEGITLGNSNQGGPSNLTNIDVYNNTVYASSGALAPAIGFSNWANGAISNIRVANNIIYSANNTKLIGAANNAGGATTSATFTNNNYYATGTFAIDWLGTTYSTWSAWRAAGNETGVNAAQGNANRILAASGHGPPRRGSSANQRTRPLRSR